MRIPWLIVMVAALGLAGCERERGREAAPTEGTTPPAEQPGTVSPAPERPALPEGTTGETMTPSERLTPSERESGIDTDATEPIAPGRDRDLSDRATEGTATAPARDE